MKKVDADNKLAELAKWRASKFSELESTLTVLIGIRDDVEASNKDRIEASKSIGRLLAVMSPEKVSVTKKDTVVAKKGADNKPTDAEWEQINQRLS